MHSTKGLFQFPFKCNCILAKRITLLLPFYYAFFLVSGFSQNQHTIDSLRQKLKKFETYNKQAGKKAKPLPDSIRVKILDGIALEYLNFNPDSAMIFASQELSISEKSGFSKGIANACITLGKILHTKGELKQAMEFYQKSLKISKEIGDRSDIAWEYWYIGLVYSAIGNYSEALKNYFMGLKLHEETGNRKGIGNIHISIGSMYFDQDVYDEALKNFNVSLKIFTETGDKIGMAQAYWNIGTVYAAQRKYPMALNYIVTGLKIFESLGMKESIANSYYSLGSVTLLMGNYPESLNYCFTALKFREATLNTDGVAEIYLLIAQVYEKQGQLKEALLYGLKGLSMVRGTGNKALLRKAYANLASVYARLGNYKTAYDNEILFQLLDDSLYSRESSNRMASLQMQYEFDKKAQADSILHANENKIHQLQLQKQKAYTGMGVAGFILLVLLLFFVYRNYKNQRKATAEMAIARQRAERSEQFKQQFLANMSHEIRTPMNAVMGMTNLLIEKNPRNDQEAYLDGIKKSSEILLHIINDILDLSKIEAGKMELEKIDFSLSVMLDQVKQTLQYRAGEKGLELRVVIDKQLPDVLEGDPFRLNQVLINLTGNAIKFTEKGSVAIEVSKGTRENEIKFSISDTGIGIPEDKLNSVFDSFTQASSSDTRKFGGTGLGLSISKQMVELMDGRISVESRLGSGTTFSFGIICPAGSRERLNQQRSSELIDGSILSGLKILLVDDNEYNLIVAGDTLKSKAVLEITEATNGKEAVECLKLGDFDVVLMDVQMPVMDGYEATNCIREQFAPPKNQVPIIALTASVIRSDLDKCREAGMNDYIHKPVKASEMITAIAKAVGREIRFSEPAISSPEPENQQNTCVTDLAYLAKFCEDDRQRMQKYIAIFVDSANPLIEKLNVALESGDYKEIASQVHGHKTKFIMMGMQETKSLADRIEKKCREERIPADVTDNVIELINQIERAKTELQLT